MYSLYKNSRNSSDQNFEDFRYSMSDKGHGAK